MYRQCKKSQHYWSTDNKWIDLTHVLFQVQVFWVVTPCSVVEGNQEHHPEDGGSIVASYHKTTRRQNPENLDLKRHLRDSFKTEPATNVCD
jgi:hypothetical protein